MWNMLDGLHFFCVCKYFALFIVLEYSDVKCVRWTAHFFFFFLQVFRFVSCAVRWDFLLKNSGYFFMEKASCESVSVLNWPILWIQTPAGVFFICRGSTLPQAHVRLNPQSLDLIKSSSWHMAHLPLRHGSPAPYSELGHKLMYWELVWSFSFLIPLPSFKFFFFFFCFVFLFFGGLGGVLRYIIL